MEISIMIALNNLLAAGATQSIAMTWIDKLNDAGIKYEINTPLRIAHFLAQIAHESAGLTATVENLNYSAMGLMKTFPKYFPTLQAATYYSRQPEKIANKVYANRMGNGGETSGDGWKYRGRGFIQLTGHDNYVRYGHENDPNNIDPADSAAWFWSTHNLNALADNDDVMGITKVINGKFNGLDDRKARLAKVKASLGI
jgi:putative chitinase